LQLVDQLNCAQQLVLQVNGTNDDALDLRDVADVVDVAHKEVGLVVFVEKDYFFRYNGLASASRVLRVLDNAVEVFYLVQFAHLRVFYARLDLVFGQEVY
jgi:hypothetical protein